MFSWIILGILTAMFGIDVATFLQTIGLIGLVGIIFAETGLLIGFFLPGDSILFAAGFLASQGVFNLPLLVVLCFFAAVIGDSVGYSFGRTVGPKLFNREDSIFFHRDHLIKAQLFYEKHGGKTIILARFMPAVRTFAPIVAGAGNMEYRKFLQYNLIGGFLWAVGLPVAGFSLGQIIPHDQIDRYLFPIIGLIILGSVAPSLYHVLKDDETRGQLANLILRRNPKRAQKDRSGSPAQSK